MGAKLPFFLAAFTIGLRDKIPVEARIFHTFTCGRILEKLLFWAFQMLLCFLSFSMCHLVPESILFRKTKTGKLKSVRYTNLIALTNSFCRLFFEQILKTDFFSLPVVPCKNDEENFFCEIASKKVTRYCFPWFRSLRVFFVGF